MRVDANPFVKRYGMMVFLLVGLGAGVCLGALIGYLHKRFLMVSRLKLNPCRGAIYGAILGLLFSVVAPQLVKSDSEIKPAKQVKKPSVIPAAKMTEPSDGKALVHVNHEADFNRYVLQASKPCLADFYSNRCIPCRMLAPVIEDLAEKFRGRAVICKVSLDYAPRLARRYNIMGIPAVVFFQEGKEIHRLVGLRRQNDYEKILEMMLVK